MLSGPSDPVVQDIGLISQNSNKTNGVIFEDGPILEEIPISGATKLRKMIFETNELIVCPGVYDGLSARTAIETGFSAMYMVSFCPSVHKILLWSIVS